VLYFKILSEHFRTNDSQRCPDGKCFRVVFKPVGGNLKNVHSCKTVSPEPFVGNTAAPAPKKPTRRQCKTPDSPEGLGAVNWEEVSFISHQEFSVPCSSPSPAADQAAITPVGCYPEKLQPDLRDTELAELTWTMTTGWCANRWVSGNYPAMHGP
ncbi:hypothetical protein BaRGS_00023963, partial [Batillaria attramentaria]